MQNSRSIFSVMVLISIMAASGFTSAYAQSSNLISPALLSPESKSSTPNLPVKFTWDTVAAATGYEIQISKYSDFPDSDTKTITTSEPFYLMSTAEEVGPTTYYWRVTSLGDAGRSDYGETFSFSLGPSPVYIYQFGKEGTGEGEFSTPAQITTDSSSDIYVTDYDGHRIQKFSSDGKPLLSWGSMGNETGQFSKPYGIVYHGGFVYVSDQENNMIQKFTTEGEFVLAFGAKGTETGQFDRPSGMAVDNLGQLLVVDSGNNRIQTFTQEGVFISAYGMYGPVGTGEGKFSSPVGIAVDNDNNVFVTDSGNHRVVKYDPNWHRVTEWGRKCTDVRGEFCNPTGIAVDNDGNVFVSDSNHRVQKFQNDGIFVSTIGSLGSLEGQFDTPLGLAIDDTNSLYVVDSGNNRIQSYEIVQSKKPPKCAGDNEWCYSFVNAAVSKPSLVLGETQTMQATILAGGSEPTGLFYLYVTIKEPDGGRVELEPLIKVMNSGEQATMDMEFKPTKVGRHSVLMEITPPERRFGHVFHTYTLDFNVEAPVTEPPAQEEVPEKPTMKSFVQELSVSEEKITLDIASTSDVTDFDFSESDKKISFYAIESQDSGVVSMPIGKVLEGPYVITVDGETKDDYLVQGDADQTTLELKYPAGTHNIVITGTRVVPEFPAAVLSIVLVSVIGAMAVLGRTRLAWR